MKSFVLVETLWLEQCDVVNKVGNSEEVMTEEMGCFKMLRIKILVLRKPLFTKTAITVVH